MKYLFLILFVVFALLSSKSHLSAQIVGNKCQNLFSNTIRPENPRFTKEIGPNVYSYLKELSLLPDKKIENKVATLFWQLTSRAKVKPENPSEVSMSDPILNVFIAPLADGPSVNLSSGFMKFGISLGFYDYLFQRYREHFPNDLIDKASEAEGKLDSSRDEIGEIILKGQSDERTIAQVRVYSGSKIELHHADIQDKSNRDLPFEKLLEQRGYRIDNTLYRLFRNIRETTEPTTRFFEIGKLITFDTTPQQNKLVMAIFEEFLLGYYLKVFPNAVFLVHVVTPFHQRFFKRNYGFKTLETFDLPDGSEEHLLYIEAQDFKQSLLKRRQQRKQSISN